MSTDLLGVAVVSCNKCGKSNSLDSKFCRSCGAAIIEADVLLAKEQNEALINDGYRLLNENRQDEAEILATTVVDNDPSSISALALLGDCHERVGRYDEALACYEKIVELNPDSALDKVRVTHLRKLLTNRALESNSGSNSRSALLAAIAAVVLVGSVGAIIALATTRSSTKTVATITPGEVQPAGIPLQGFGPNLGSIQPPVDGAESVGEPKTTPPTAGSTPPVNSGANSTTGGRPVPPVDPSGTLPNPVGNGKTVNPNEGTVAPWQPFGKGPVSIEKSDGTGAAAPPNLDNPDPRVDNTANSTVPAKQAAPEPVIEIRASGGSAKVTQGGGEIESPGGAVKADTLIRVARNQFMTGNYAGAADAYEKALRAGAPAGSTNQRLAQCFEKLGRTSEAIAAYGRAAKAFDASGSASAAAACRQAIKVLQGG